MKNYFEACFCKCPVSYGTLFFFIFLAINPNNTNEFAFSGGISEGGLKIVKDGAIISEVYRTNNSTLEAYGGEISIGDMKYDDAGNLWIVSTGVEPLKVLTPAGDWYSFSLSCLFLLPFFHFSPFFLSFLFFSIHFFFSI